MFRRHTVFSVWAAYVGFVIYGSLVPLRPRELSLDAARQAFAQIPFLSLGLESRADWIANGVLYVPVGLLTLLVLAHRGTSPARAAVRWAWAPVALAFSLLLAAGVEFVQLWFPPRTVSLNDLLAEAVGAALGVALAAHSGDQLGTLWRALVDRGRGSAERLLGAYVLAYVVLALFPYDLLLSVEELSQKAASDLWGWLLAGSGDRPFLRLARLAAEWLATLPVGCWLAGRTLPGRRRTSRLPARVVVLALLFGAAVEGAQFFIASGTSQGASLLARAAGVVCGWLLWRRSASLRMAHVVAWLRRFGWPLAIVHAAALAVLSGWASASWGGLDAAGRAWAGLELMPFYYHYYTTEARAVASLGRVLLAYAPVGLLVWAHGRPALLAAAWGGALAVVIEAGKLFLPQLRPDPTAVLLAMASAWATVQLLSLASRAAAAPAVPQAGGGGGYPAAAVHRPGTALPARRALAAAALALGAWGALAFPLRPLVLLAGLAVCAALVWQRPVRLLVIVLAALPALDLAPWSGRTFPDELDLLLLVGLGVAFLRTPVPAERAAVAVPAPFVAVAMLLALSWAIAVARGLLPWQWLDANSFSSYHSPWNALRIAKGAVWAWLLCRWLQRLLAAGVDVRPAVTLGMTWGLAFTVAAVVWERAAFVGLFDFADTYRVTGLFSAMHTGGAYIECYLAMSAPFAVVLALRAQRLAVRVAAVLLLLGAAYAVMVTFSRNGYLAFAVGLATVGAAALRAGGAGRPRRSLALAGLAVGVLAVALPVLLGPFAQQRMAQAQVRGDLAVRQAHWADALALRASDLATTLLGVGIGRFPEAHFWGSREPARAAVHRLQGEGGELYLQLGPGSPLYFEQIVSLPASGAPLEFEVRLRSQRPGAALTVALCEKWMLTSRRCAAGGATAGPQPGQWSTARVALPAAGLAEGPWFARPTLKLSLLNQGEQPVDVDGLALRAAGSDANLLVNGDFSRGMDRWFFSVDADPPWHIHSLPVSVLFDQGVLGLVATGAFLLVALGLGLRAALAGSTWAGAAAASLAAFTVCGVLNTLIDAPRILLLMLFVAWCCAVPARARSRATAAAVRRPPHVPEAASRLAGA